jgi:hypothetical protein
MGCLKSRSKGLFTFVFLCEVLCDPLCLSILQLNTKDTKVSTKALKGLFLHPHNPGGAPAIISDMENAASGCHYFTTNSPLSRISFEELPVITEKVPGSTTRSIDLL